MPSRGRARPAKRVRIAQLIAGVIIVVTLATGLIAAARGRLISSDGTATDDQPVIAAATAIDMTPVPINVVSTAAAAVPPPPSTSAASVFALDATTGQPIFARAPDEHRAPASLAKMAGGLVVVHAIAQGLITVDDPVTIDAADVVDPNVYSHMGLVAGDTLTVEQLLYGSFLPSGDDASRALARYVGAKLPGGDPDTGGDPTAVFVQAMNQLAQSLGLRDTHFVNPDGTDDPAQYTTARDLAALGAAVLQSPLLRTIVNTASITVTSIGQEQRQYDLINTNRLLALDGVDGIKTGTTDAAGSCLVASARLENGDRLIVVVLGSAPDNPDPKSDALTWPRFADALTILRAAGAVIH